MSKDKFGREIPPTLEDALAKQTEASKRVHDCTNELWNITRTKTSVLHTSRMKELSYKIQMAIEELDACVIDVQKTREATSDF